MSDYTPHYLTYLDNCKGIRGWPDGVTEEGIEFATKKAKEYLDKYGCGRLSSVHDYIFMNRHEVPVCLRSSLYDFLYAVTYRALLQANAQNVFMAEEKSPGTQDEERWMIVKLSRKDVKILAGLIWGLSKPVQKRLKSLFLQLAKWPLFNHTQINKLTEEQLFLKQKWVPAKGENFGHFEWVDTK